MIISRSHGTKPLLIASHLLRRLMIEKVRFSARPVPSWLRFFEIHHS
jgi:hypothetical protein